RRIEAVDLPAEEPGAREREATVRAQERHRSDVLPTSIERAVGALEFDRRVPDLQGETERELVVARIEHVVRPADAEEREAVAEPHRGALRVVEPVDAQVALQRAL